MDTNRIVASSRRNRCLGYCLAFPQKLSGPRQQGLPMREVCLLQPPVMNDALGPMVTGVDAPNHLRALAQSRCSIYQSTVRRIPSSMFTAGAQPNSLPARLTLAHLTGGSVGGNC